MNAARDKIWADLDRIEDMTPREYEKHASHVLRAIRDCQNSIYVSCPRYGSCELTDYGMRLAGRI